MALAQEASQRAEQEQLARELDETKARLLDKEAELTAEKEAARCSDADAKEVHLASRLRVVELEAEVERLKAAAAKKKVVHDTRTQGHRAFRAASVEFFFDNSLPPVPPRRRLPGALPLQVALIARMIAPRRPLPQQRARRRLRRHNEHAGRAKR